MFECGLDFKSKHSSFDQSHAHKYTTKRKISSSLIITGSFQVDAFQLFYKQNQWFIIGLISLNGKILSFMQINPLLPFRFVLCHIKFCVFNNSSGFFLHFCTDENADKCENILLRRKSIIKKLFTLNE